MKSHLVFVAFILCVLAHISNAAPFRSARGYTFSPPPGWKRGANFGGVEAAFYAPRVNGFAPNINVAVQKVSPGTTLAQLRKGADTMLPRILTNWKKLVSDPATLAGTRGIRTIGTYRLGTPPRQLRMYQVAALHKGRLYAFTGTATADNYAAAENAVKKAIASVRWTK